MFQIRMGGTRLGEQHIFVLYGNIRLIRPLWFWYQNHIPYYIFVIDWLLNFNFLATSVTHTHSVN